ncbi:MAG: GGDEF domain-containing protein [Acidobacteriaceae bacterium]
MEDQIQTFGRNHFQWLNFGSELEAQFEQDTAARRGYRLWIEGVIAILVYDLFLISDHLIFPEKFFHAVIIRIAIVTPIAVIANTAMRFKLTRFQRESALVVVMVLCGISVLNLYFDVGKVVSAYAQTSVILILMFGNIVMRLRFPYALAGSVICFAADMVYLWLDPWLTNPEKIVSVSLVSAAVIFTLVANYSMEREERISYLLRLRGDMQSQDLSYMNAELTRLSNLDTLTGLANRRYFDTYFAWVWQQAIQQKHPLSLVMIDIDYFKNLNDKYGHLYGDIVLAHIARALQQGLRRKEDFVARYGGEEFVVLLPNMTLEDAQKLAERLRISVKSSEMPLADAGQTVMPATISCGVASLYPTSENAQQELIHTADRALYKAKAGGRDQVCTDLDEVRSSRKKSFAC